MDIIYTPNLLDRFARPYAVQDFWRFAMTHRTEARIVECRLYYIPSRKSSYHEFLLAHVEDSQGRLVVIIQRSSSNNGIRAMSSDGGLARDTIAFVPAMGYHEYWQSPSARPMCRGTLRWHHPLPHLSSIALFANVASTNFTYYNLYIRQCYWYARIIQAAMERAFPSCSSEGTTSSSSRMFPILGNYSPSQLQHLINQHSSHFCTLPPTEVEQHAPRLTTPYILHGLAASTVTPPGWFIWQEVVFTNAYGNRIAGGMRPVYGVFWGG
ncbi:hypothetical protein F5J12DRAFT_322746 [Pisolithus orientalis]|uniref:uncharacterized protein n=1 Tax=Pisolithus orientalis TaxID=936130 RepID=UPI0022249510|nr:uncharacterized protein F5J12DRAFT_322746 [Pisolithus orientalis]KAI5998325.1 hypothetical protein F5J12DRAFT_322746 [Pisolithus orientalis]